MKPCGVMSFHLRPNGPFPVQQVVSLPPALGERRGTCRVQVQRARGGRAVPHQRLVSASAVQACADSWHACLVLPAHAVCGAAALRQQCRVPRCRHGGCAFNPGGHFTSLTPQLHSSPFCACGAHPCGGTAWQVHCECLNRWCLLRKPPAHCSLVCSQPAQHSGCAAQLVSRAA